MEEEWRDRLEEYENAVGAEEASEAGFFKWMPQIDRNRGKAAFKEAMIQSQLDTPDLAIREYVKRAGDKSRADGLSLNEATLKNKVLGRLVRMDPLDAKGESFAAYRAVETENILFLLNTLADLALTPQPGETELIPARAHAAKRMLYQSALSYLSDLLKRVFAHYTMVDELGLTRLTDLQKEEVQKAIGRIVAHPVWSEPYTRDGRMEAIKNALEKNQEARKAFEGVALDLSWAVVGDESVAFKSYWRP
jgi:hypothetical protein